MLSLNQVNFNFMPAQPHSQLNNLNKPATKTIVVNDMVFRMSGMIMLVILAFTTDNWVLCTLIGLALFYLMSVMKYFRTSTDK